MHDLETQDGGFQGTAVCRVGFSSSVRRIQLSFYEMSTSVWEIQAVITVKRYIAALSCSHIDVYCI